MNIVWFRKDLRLVDNPAFYHACKDSDFPVIAIYCFSRKQFEKHWIGINQQALIVSQLIQLAKELKTLNIPLLVLDCDYSNSHHVINRLVEAIRASALYFNVEIPFDERERDKRVVECLSTKINCKRYYSDSLVPPWKLKNKTGTGYKVFTPFSKALKLFISERPLWLFSKPEAKSSDHFKLVVDSINQASNQIASLSIETLKNEFKHEFKCNFPLPDLSYEKSRAALVRFCKTNLAEYAHKRDYPAVEGTSNLSRALALGTISVGECYLTASEIGGESSSKWLDELIWRDFYRSVMWHYPRVSKNKAFNPLDQYMRWNQAGDALNAFYQGHTGVPIIDAAIQQLLQTGWMHNRLRMIVASFFTKNLWGDWRLGEKFFASHLMDYDFPSNNAGWQWSASIGTDAAPYFRVFNPQAQQMKYDPEVSFIKYWLPQLKGYSAKEIHQFESKKLNNYPQCIVSLKSSRLASIEKFKQAAGRE